MYKIWSDWFADLKTGAAQVNISFLHALINKNRCFWCKWWILKWWNAHYRWKKHVNLNYCIEIMWKDLKNIQRIDYTKDNRNKSVSEMKIKINLVRRGLNLDQTHNYILMVIVILVYLSIILHYTRFCDLFKILRDII